MPPDEGYSRCVGVTYVSLNSDNSEELKKRLLFLCQLRKYRSKGNIWIGFGSLRSSSEIIDVVAYNDNDWEYDEELEKMIKTIPAGTQVRIGKKTGRNDKCPCSSNRKYKKCCGSNI